MTMTTPILTAKREAFAQLIAAPDCKGPLAAYEAAGFSMRSPKSAQEEASKLLANPNVAQRIVELRNAAAAPVIAEATTVLREWLAIATADPAELIRARRWCCRYCYGFEHRYQWRDEQEFALAIATVIDRNAQRAGRRGAFEEELPDCAGGFGYERNIAPHAKCPRCFGDGEIDVFVPDTHTLSAAGRKLYAGIKTTQHGIEIKMRDQDAALANLAKHLGMFIERNEHSGPGGGPIPTASIIAEVDARKAGEIYAQVMTGKAK